MFSLKYHDCAESCDFEMKKTLNIDGGFGSIFDAPLRVHEVMTTPTTCLHADQSLSDVVTLMANRFFHHVLVVDTEERLIGVISDRDVFRALARTRDWHTKLVKEIMSAEPVTTTPDAFISVAAKEMLNKRINCLPVIDPNGKLCGIVTSTDLIKRFEKIQSAIETSKAFATPKSKLAR